MCAHSVSASLSRRNAGRAGEALIEHARQRVLVAAGVDALAGDLLGGEVVERAHEPAGVGRHAAELLAHAEVGQVGVVVVVDQDVGRLDVAVHERGPVRRVERARDLPEQRQRPLERQRAVARSSVLRSLPST